ncbi:MAG: HAD-IIB family hydrolase [bacterium]|nr:HAD-IIB family hydrolase [bacterium]
MNHLIFTDLDGTLLDHHSYSYQAARPALDWLASQSIPVVLVSSKTASEMKDLQQELDLQHPFVSENGGGIYLPEGYFEGRRGPLRAETLGATRAELLDFIAPYYDQYKFVGFDRMSAEEVAQSTGLPLERAQQAKEREFSEPLLWQDRPEAAKELAHAAQVAGYKLVRGGRFWHLMGPTDKAGALISLSGRYQKMWDQKPVTIALGDSPNDIGMLEAANVAVVLSAQENAPLKLHHSGQVLRPEGAGPTGWCQAMQQYFGF